MDLQHHSAPKKRLQNLSPTASALDQSFLHSERILRIERKRSKDKKEIGLLHSAHRSTIVIPDSSGPDRPWQQRNSLDESHLGFGRGGFCATRLGRKPGSGEEFISAGLLSLTAGCWPRGEAKEKKSVPSFAEE